MLKPQVSGLSGRTPRRPLRAPAALRAPAVPHRRCRRGAGAGRPQQLRQFPSMGGLKLLGLNSICCSVLPPPPAAARRLARLAPARVVLTQALRLRRRCPPLPQTRTAPPGPPPRRGTRGGVVVVVGGLVPLVFIFF